MIFHEDHLLADDSHVISYLIFVENWERCLKICRLLQSRVKLKTYLLFSWPEVSSIMQELAGRSLTGTYLYLLCVKPDTSTTSASKRSDC